MPITPHAKCDYDILFADAVRFLGIAANPEATAVMPTAPYTAFFLKKRIVQADIEIVTLICQTEDHPFREEFFTEEPNEITDGDFIPAYMGVHGGVYYKTASSEFKLAQLATDYDHLKRVKNNSGVYGARPDLYWIHNSRLHLGASGGKAKVYVPTIPVQTVTSGRNPQLYTPRAYQNGLLANVIGNLRTVGANQSHRNDWFSIWQGYSQMIQNRALSLPEPERMERIGT